MKIQGKVFLGVSLFFLVEAIVYGYWSEEPAGTAALFLAFGLNLMVGFYLTYTAKRVDSGPQDRKNADVADDAGEVGFFSPHSWQPLALAFGGALAFLGVAVGWWIMYFSLPILLMGIWGWVFEYYRGESRTQ